MKFCSPLKTLAASITLAWTPAWSAQAEEPLLDGARYAQLGFLDLFKSTPKEQAPTPPGMAGLPDVDWTKVISRPMSAKELFEQQGMFKTMNLAQKMAADAKAGKGGAFVDAMGTLTLDTASMLRLASKLTASYLSYSALETLMKSFSDNPRIMEGVKVDVPQVGAFGYLQLHEDTLGVARFLAAMKASNLLVAESEKSLEAAKARYKAVLTERDEKAKSLGQAHMLLNGAFIVDPGSLKSASDLDLAYLKKFEGKPLDEVLKDEQAKQLIHKVLQEKFPGEYTSILAGEKEVAQHYSEYSKTSVGTMSMIGFAAVFLSNVVDMGSQSHAHKLLLAPMAKDGVIELVSIAKNIASALSKNDQLVEGTFSLTADGKTITGIPASKVLKSLAPEQLAGFRSSMIGNSSTSFVSQLDRRSPVFAADILDRLVDRDTKQAFAKTAFSVENPDTFSFKAAFAPTPQATEVLKPADKNIKLRVYEESFDKAEDPTEKIYGSLQAKVRSDVEKITNQDLRRIMLVQGTEALNLGNAVIRMEQPGLQGLADRQEMTVASLQQVMPDVGAPAPAEKTAPAATPATKPESNKKSAAPAKSSPKSKNNV